MKKLLGFSLFILCYFCLAPYVRADQTDVCNQPDKQTECQQLIDDLNQKIATAQGNAKTLGGQITYYDNQITLNQLKIAQTTDLISVISQKIDVLETKLEQRVEYLQKQIVATYKQEKIDPIELIFSSDNFSQMLDHFKYAQETQSSSRKMLHDTQLIQTNYAQQKDLIESSKKRLQFQKADLDSLRAQKDLLLKQTKNDEANYQKLLNEAIAQRNALALFTEGGGLLPPQSSPDGWYMNQRDQRWGGACIGTTCGSKNPSLVWQYGCLITSVAMLQKKNGMNVTPADIASNTSYFFQDLMWIPWPSQPGFKFTVYNGRNLSLVDSELAAGRPVIIGLKFANGSEHFIVIKSKNGPDYIMNDPWFGPDLKFSDHYSTSSIISVSTYIKS